VFRLLVQFRAGRTDRRRRLPNALTFPATTPVLSTVKPCSQAAAGPTRGRREGSFSNSADFAAMNAPDRLPSAKTAAAAVHAPPETTERPPPWLSVLSTPSCSCAPQLLPLDSSPESHVSTTCPGQAGGRLSARTASRPGRVHVTVRWALLAREAFPPTAITAILDDLPQTPDIRRHPSSAEPAGETLARLPRAWCMRTPLGCR